MDEINTVTLYDGSTLCPTCGGLMDPVASAFSGPTGECSNCRNKSYGKNLKAAMAKPR
jgi:hypothetical protein